MVAQRKEPSPVTQMILLLLQISHHKKKHGVVAPKRLIGRLRRDNELFRSYMHQASTSLSIPGPNPPPPPPPPYPSDRQLRATTLQQSERSSMPVMQKFARRRRIPPRFPRQHSICSMGYLGERQGGGGGGGSRLQTCTHTELKAPRNLYLRLLRFNRRSSEQPHMHGYN